MTFTTLALAVFTWGLPLPGAGDVAVLAQDVQEIPVMQAGSEHDVLLRFKRALGLSGNDDLLISKVELRNQKGSHLRVQYASSTPLAMLFIPLTSEEILFRDYPNYLSAVLPASPSGDAVVSMMNSPNFRREQKMVLVYFYVPPGSEPSLQSLTVEDRSSSTEYLFANFRQLLRSEVFRIASINSLFGYSFAAIPFSLVLGILFLIGVLFLSWRTRSVVLGFSVSAIVVLLLYNVRFVADMTGITAAEAKQWFSGGTYNEGGDLFLAASSVRKISELSESPPAFVACTSFLTMLRYYVFPLEIHDTEEAWKQATHGILLSSWKEENGNMSCGGNIPRKATVLERFPEGGAIVRFE